MQKVKFIKNGHSIKLAHVKGDVIEVSDQKALSLVEMGYAEAYTPEAPKADLPENMPARAILISEGILTRDEVQAMVNDGSITDIKGIGKGLAKSIQDYFSE